MINSGFNPSQEVYDRQVAYWLLVCAGTIFGMIILGAVTRLTQSGLSMVDWHPVTGIIPPLTEADWQEEFFKYQQFPEYQKKNLGMSIADFKTIFLFEYFHRLLGRFIGLLFLMPFLFFYFTNRLRSGLTPKLTMLFILGGFQGLLGWYMVKSGLVDDPNVSQYRLTAHLGTAVLIYGAILWVAWSLLFKHEEQLLRLRTSAAGVSCAIFLMILSGGLVAGTKAGYIYPTFPLMGHSFFPEGLYSMKPVWLSAFEDLATIQFNHRIFAYVIVLVVSIFTFFALKFRPTGPTRIGILSMFAMMILQVLLGISTLIMNMPIALATAHQGGAVLLLTASLFVTHSLVMVNTRQPINLSVEAGVTTSQPITAVHSGRM
jgi:cytochrome c oxidase assembly protein subunit 15